MNNTGREESLDAGICSVSLSNIQAGPSHVLPVPQSHTDIITRVVDYIR